MKKILIPIIIISFVIIIVYFSNEKPINEQEAKLWISYDYTYGADSIVRVEQRNEVKKIKQILKEITNESEELDYYEPPNNEDEDYSIWFDSEDEYEGRIDYDIWLVNDNIILLNTNTGKYYSLQSDKWERLNSFLKKYKEN